MKRKQSSLFLFSACGVYSNATQSQVKILKQQAKYKLDIHSDMISELMLLLIDFLYVFMCLFVHFQLCYSSQRSINHNRSLVVEKAVSVGDVCVGVAF